MKKKFKFAFADSILGLKECDKCYKPQIVKKSKLPKRLRFLRLYTRVWPEVVCKNSYYTCCAITGAGFNSSQGATRAQSLKKALELLKTKSIKCIKTSMAKMNRQVRDLEKENNEMGL